MSATLDVAPVFDLARYGDRPALITPDATLSYAELGAAADDLASAWGPGRRVVLVAMRNDVASVVSYLAALNHGHVPLLLPGDRPDIADDVLARYAPDVVCAGARRTSRVDQPRHRLHPDLALLLSTSGSTGSPRLVRLSRENLRSNASAIAACLALTSADVAITSLPLHYCYGLSVLHSHLAVGASVALTELSVVDDCFWEVPRVPRSRRSRRCRTRSTCSSAPVSPTGSCRRCDGSRRRGAGSHRSGSVPSPCSARTAAGTCT